MDNATRAHDIVLSPPVMAPSEKSRGKNLGTPTRLMPTTYVWNYVGGADGSPEAERRGERNAHSPATQSSTTCSRARCEHHHRTVGYMYIESHHLSVVDWWSNSRLKSSVSLG